MFISTIECIIYNIKAENYTTFEVFKIVIVKITVFWDVTPCCVAKFIP
jgi:hypothetical protein